ncbi:MAG: hypothetical protein K0R24_1061 [Gammaproteobacteria bacterium]|jgi:hypothetical protein|nr:hypothetical protein [Gammaproteobacteria bacterium]
MSICWEQMLPALVHDPWYILKGTFVFVVALVTLPALLYKISVHGVAIVAFTYLMLHEVSEYFFPDPQQLTHVLAETAGAQRQRSENDPLRPYANGNRTNSIAALIGRMIDSRGRLLWILLKRDFDLAQDPVIAVRNCLKLLFLILAVTGAVLVATVPAVSVWGIFGYITQTLVAIGVTTPGVLSIGQVGVTFGVIYASRTFSIGIGLLLASLFKSLYKCIPQYIDKREVELDADNRQGPQITSVALHHRLTRTSSGSSEPPPSPKRTANDEKALENKSPRSTSGGTHNFLLYRPAPSLSQRAATPSLSSQLNLSASS